MDETKKVFMHLDILGFDEQAKQTEEIHEIPSWKARKNVAAKVGEIIKSHLKENKCKQTSPDSWMFLFDDTNSALEYAKNIQKSMEGKYNLISLEIGITCESIDIGCDEFWYTDAAMLAVKICGKYRNAYKQRHNESIKKSFVVIHESTYKEIEQTVKDSLSSNLKCEKINNEVVYSYDPSLYSHPSSISTIKSKREGEKVEKKLEEHQAITLYDPAHMEDIFMELIKRSKKIDLCLYTAETLSEFPYRDILRTHQGIEIRILVINPDSDERKKKSASACIETWRYDIYRQNRNCKVSIGLYEYPPLLRAIIFDEKEAFLSIYKWDPKKYYRFMGVEGNKLLHVTRDTEFGSWLLDLYQSRFEYGWQESKKVVIPKAVIFDMDGVIIDSMPYHADAWKKAFASVGIKISDQDIYLREGENPKRIVEDICEKSDIKISEEEIKKVIEEKEKKFNEVFEIKLFPGVKDFLAERKEESFLLGLVTGAPKEVMDNVLLQTGLNNFFKVTISGEILENGKPMPDPYLKALEEFKKFDINVEDCIVVENSPSGIRSAKEAGLECIALTTSLSRDQLTDADIIVDLLEDVKEYL